MKLLPLSGQNMWHQSEFAAVTVFIQHMASKQLLRHSNKTQELRGFGACSMELKSVKCVILHAIARRKGHVYNAL